MQSLTASGAGANPENTQGPVVRLYDLAPKKPYCTDLKGAGLIIRSRDSAFTRSYVQHNPPALCHWLTFDQDHENLTLWEEANLPEPNLIVRNLENRRAHVSYAIESVCTSEAGRPGPMAYAQAIQAAYCEKLKADPGYTGLITKNPMHEDWHVWELHSHVYKLGELAKFVDLQRRYWTRKRAANREHYGLGRNCALFHRTRFWGYDHVPWHRDNGTVHNEWMELVLERCDQYNVFHEALPYSEVKSTAKSVGNFCWFKYWPTGKRVRRGLMAEELSGSELPLDLAARQRLSARRTHTVRRSATEEKIIAAIGELTRTGQKITKAVVGRMIGISRQKVSESYSHLFMSE